MKTTRTHGPNEKEMGLAKLLTAECQTTGDIQEKLCCLIYSLMKSDNSYEVRSE